MENETTLTGHNADHAHLIGEILDEVEPREIVRRVIEAAYAAGYEKHSDGITLMPELGFGEFKMKHPVGVGHDWLYFMGMANPFLPSTVATEWQARLWCDNWFSDALKDFGHPIRARVWWLGLRIGAWHGWNCHRKAKHPWSSMMLTAVLCLLFAGCAVVRVQTPTWSCTAGSLFKEIEVPSVSVATNGTLQVIGYKGGVDGEAAGTVAAMAIKAAK